MFNGTEGRLRYIALRLAAGAALGVAIIGTVAACHDEMRAPLDDASLAAAADSAGPLAIEHAFELPANEVLAQKAIAKGLDHDPSVIQELERARQQILARAYARLNVPPDAEITAAERRAFYHNNPALFEHRKIYHLTAFSVALKDINRALRRDLEQTHSSKQVQALLAARHVALKAKTFSRAAEQLPMAMLPVFATVKVGDVLIAPQSTGAAMLISVTRLEDSPIGFEKASSNIEQYLIGMRARLAADDRVKNDQAIARISYEVGSSGRNRNATAAQALPN